MPIILALVVILSGGVAIGSNSALPGEVLYLVKVSVVEPVFGSLNISSKARANWEANLAFKRLEEFENLAVEGKLTSEQRASLSDEFNARMKNSEAIVIKMSQDGDNQKASELSSEIQAKLSAHNKVLVLAGITGEGFNLDSSLNTFANLNAQVENSISANAQVDIEVAAKNRLEVAKRRVEAVKEDFDANSSKLSAEGRAEVQVKIEESESLLAQAEAKFEAEAYNEAFQLSQEAQLLVQEVNTMLNVFLNIDTQADVNLNAGEGLIEANSNADINLDLNSELY